MSVQTRFQVLRGTTAQRLAITPRVGEPVWDTDLNELYIGDGATAGGIAPLAGSQGPQGDPGPIGNDGPQGIQGIQGDPGPTGPAGPTGPVSLDIIITEPGTVTLPNTTTKTLVYSNTENFPATASYYLQIMMAVTPHTAGNDMEFDLRIDGSTFGPDYAEEHKDQSNVGSMWRMMQVDLGVGTAGNHDIELFFSKEGTGGTAQLKYYSVSVWRYS